MQSDESVQRTEDFAKAYAQKRNLILRTIDAMCHILAAVCLVWLCRVPWYWGFWQWLPDVCLLFMWPHGMITHRWLSEQNPIIVLHKRVFHAWLFWMMFTLGMALSMCVTHHVIRLELFICVNALFHLSIDFFTHEGDFK